MAGRVSIGAEMATEPMQAWLSIWRNFAPTVPLAMQDAKAGWRIVDTDSTLQEQVYSWPLSIRSFAGIEDDDVRGDLRKALFGRLDVSLPPVQRSIAVLHEFVEKAEQAVSEGHAGPVTTDSIPAAPSTHTPLEPNPLLALVVHLKWLVRCFGDRPNVSVTIR